MALGDVYAEVTAVGIQGLSGGGGTGNGATGSTGPAGGDGATGPVGASGASGIGYTGATGSTGPQGIQGASGAGSGSSGATGPQGASGIAGASGINGASGYIGIDGASGTQGASGINGSTGAQGASGVGLSGATGASGIGFTVIGEWNDTTTYNRNDVVTYQDILYIWVSETSGNTVGNPETDVVKWYQASAIGASGAAGATGAGLTGATGIQGASGATGTQGASGSGDTGATGIQGASGATGTQGASGAGIDGASGATGALGPTGATGVGGASGYVGTDGATGIRGASGSTGLTGATGGVGPVGASGAGVISEIEFITDGTTDEQLLDVIDTTEIRSVKYEMQVSRGLDVQVSELRLLHDDADVFLNEYGILGVNLGDFATYFSPLSNSYSSPSISTGGTSYWNGTNVRIYTTSNTVIKALQSIIVGLDIRLNNTYTVNTTSKFVEVSSGIWQASVTQTRSPILLLTNIAWDGTGTCELRFTANASGTTTLKYIRTDLSV